MMKVSLARKELRKKSRKLFGVRAFFVLTVFAVGVVLLQNAYAGVTAQIDVTEGLATGGAVVKATLTNFDFYATPSASHEYVQDGLIFHLDAIDNEKTGDAGHNNSATVWRDLTANGHDANLTATTWSNDALNFNGTNSFGIMDDNMELPQETTIEIYGKTGQGTEYQIPFVDKTGEHAMGYYYLKTTEQGESGPEEKEHRALLATACGFISRRGFAIPDDGLSYDDVTNFTLTRRYKEPNSVSLAINGNNLQNNENVTNCWNNSGVANYLGRRDNGAFYKGTMSSVRAYDRTLSDLEVKWNNTVDKNRFDGSNITLLNITSLRVQNKDIPFTINEHNELVLTMPAYSPGTYDIILVDGLGNKVILGEFTYYHTISSVEPSVGPTSGGNTLTIKGTGFPEKYNVVENGLILNYMGDNNTGNGYDSTATTWKDLSGNNFDAVLNNITWTDGGAVFNGTLSNYATISRQMTLPVEATIEIIQKTSRVNGIVFSDKTNTHFMGFFQTAKGFIATTTTRQLFDVPMTLPAYDGTSIFTLSRRYVDLDNVYMDINTTSLDRIATSNFWSANNVDNIIGQRRNSAGAGSQPFKGTIYAMRIYDRVLTDDELIANFCQDVARYGIDPGMVDCGTNFKVKVNGAECTGINRIDGETIECTVPASTIPVATDPYREGMVDVELNINGVVKEMQNSYYYRAPMEISGILPDIGPVDGGTEVEINGHNFIPYLESANDVFGTLSVDLGDSPCIILRAEDISNNQIKCTSSVHNAPERVDVVVDNGKGQTVWSASKPGQGGFLYTGVYLSLARGGGGVELLSGIFEQKQDYLTALVQTNSPAGYSFTMEAFGRDLVCESGPDHFSSITAAGTIGENQWGWAQSLSLTAGVPDVPTIWQPIPLSPVVIKTKTEPSGPSNDGADGDAYHIYFAAKNGLDLPPCLYGQTIVFTAVKN